MHIESTAVGRNPHIRQIDVVFANPVIDTGSVPETVSPVGGLIALRTAAAVVELVSSSASDAAAGTGARTIEVHGLDADYNEVSETFTMNGATPVVGTTLFFRINHVHVRTAGTGKTNAGYITIQDAGAGTTRSYIGVGRGRSEVGVFTVPAGHTMLAVYWSLASRDGTGSSSADVEFWATKDGVRSISWVAIAENTISVSVPNTPHTWGEKTDIEVIVARVQNNSTVVSFHGHGLLVGPNADLA